MLYNPLNKIKIHKSILEKTLSYNRIPTSKYKMLIGLHTCATFL